MSRVEKAREWMMRGADASTSKRLGMFLRPVFLVSMIVLALVVAWLYPDSRQEARALPLASAAHPPAGLTEQTTSKLPFRRQLGAIIAEPRRRSRDHSLESAFAQLAADADAPASDRFLWPRAWRTTAAPDTNGRDGAGIGQGVGGLSDGLSAADDWWPPRSGSIAAGPGCGQCGDGSIAH